MKPGGMCQRLRSIVLLATALLAGGCGSGLVEYTSSDGEFRILLPGPPSATQDPDLPRRIHKITFEEQSGSYSVAWEDLGKSTRTAEERLEAACKKGVEKLQGKTVRKKSITLGGVYPGRDLVAEWPEGKGVVHDRIYLVNNRLYHVIASGPRWWVESAKSQRVLDSFRVVAE